MELALGLAAASCFLQCAKRIGPGSSARNGTTKALTTPIGPSTAVIAARIWATPTAARMGATATPAIAESQAHLTEPSTLFLIQLSLLYPKEG